MAREHNIIKRKLITAIMVTSLAVLALTCLVFINYEYFSFRTSLARGLTTRAEIIAANASASLAFQNASDGAEILSALRKDSHIEAACLYDEQGRLFASHPFGSGPADARQIVPGEKGRTKVNIQSRPYFRFENGYAVVVQPIVHDKRWLGTFYMKSDLAEMRDRFRIYAGLVAVVIIACIGLAFGLSSWLQKRISEPILNLTNTARSVSEHKDYTLRAQKMSADEIGLLTDSFNEMLDQIQLRDASLRRTEEEVRKLNTNLEKRVEERTCALAEANQELESFSYSVSHDLRAPLRHIDGYLSLLSKSADAVLDEKGKHYLSTISESARHMGRLIDELLAFCRMGRAEMRSTRVNVDELVKASVNDLAMETQGRNIVWKIDPLPPVDADPALLRQVWANLLSNAVKYTRGRERAEIEIGALRARRSGPGPTFGADDARKNGDPFHNSEQVFFVRDNGAGFDMQYVEKLFGVFQRLHRSDEFEGTGIGLANVRRIIHRHHGRTWAEGKVDAGATFYFSLPQINQASARPEGPLPQRNEDMTIQPERCLKVA